MRILLSQWMPNIRLYKWAETLSLLLYEVDIAHHGKMADYLRWDAYKVMHISDVNPADYAMHISFNTNTKFSYIPGFKSTIQAVGDLALHKPGGKRLELEKEALSLSDAAVFISDGQRDYAIKEYGLDAKRCFVLHNAMVYSLLGARGRMKRPGRNAVYAGTLSGERGHYRYLFDEFKAFMERFPDITLHVYPSFHTKNVEIPRGVVYHYPVSPYELVSELSQYQYGYIVLNNPGVVSGYFLPNKFFEYKAAELEILTKSDYTAIRQASIQYAGQHQILYDHLHLNNILLNA